MQDRYKNVDYFAPCCKVTRLSLATERGGPTVILEAHVAVQINLYSVTWNRRYTFRM